MVLILWVYWWPHDTRIEMVTTLSLSEFHKIEKSGAKSALIVGFQGSQEVTERLQELGLRQGSTIEILGRAPFAGPGLYRIGSVVVALRAEEAECVSIQPVAAN